MTASREGKPWFERSTRRWWYWRKTSTLQGSARSEWTAQYLLTSLPPSQSPPERSVGPMATCGYGFLDACDGKPQCIVQVLRVWRSHCYSEGAGDRLLHAFRHARQHVRRRDGGQGGNESGGPPKPGNAVQAIDGMAWQVRMCIIEANLAALSGQPKREFKPARMHQPTGKRGSRQRNDLLETPRHQWEHAIKRRWSRREIYRCARCGRAGNPKTGNLSPRLCNGNRL